ncbi:transglutaminase-like cysteine peptidase [Bradyrhizobium sp. LjRoot220]|uniref:transglutaminase-like cysteine peptidase n=1 Tax=Bradyrhizobium sp. LjRoot220 TaxID=3342284 RepID=UPI003ECE3A17
MAISDYPRALRATFLGCSLLASSLAWFGPVAAGTLLSPGTAVLIKKSVEPFGQPTAMLLDGRLHQKWQSLQRRLDDEMVQLALCEGDREGCVSPAALQFLAIVDAARLREGRARLGEINRAINLAVKATSDLAQYGELDVWASPLATLTRGGDCEDYAIAKFVALRLAGIAPDDLRIVIMRDTIRGGDHAVAAARLDGRWLMLDNRRMAMVEDSDIRNVRPTYMLDRHSVMRYTDAPVLVASSSNPEAPVVVNSLAAPSPIAPADQALPQAD